MNQPRGHDAIQSYDAVIAGCQTGSWYQIPSKTGPSPAVTSSCVLMATS